MESFVTTYGTDSTGPFIEFDFDGRIRRVWFHGLADLNAELKQMGVGELLRGWILGDVQRLRREGWAA